MSNARAFLYDAEGRPVGVAGAAVSPTLVVFSPWPRQLGQDAPFAVRLVPAAGADADGQDAGAGEWRQADRVEYVRLDGSPEAANLALVDLAEPTTLPGEQPSGVSRDDVVSTLRTSAPRDAVAILAPQVLGFLAGGPPAARPLSPSVAAEMPRPSTPPAFVTRSGPAESVQVSICRIFRWD